MERAADQPADCSRCTPQQPEMHVAHQLLLSDDELELGHDQTRTSELDDRWEDHRYVEEPVGMDEKSHEVSFMP